MFIKRPKKLQGFFGGGLRETEECPKKFWAGRREELRLELIEPSGASENERQHTPSFPRKIRKIALK